MEKFIDFLEILSGQEKIDLLNSVDELPDKQFTSYDKMVIQDYLRYHIRLAFKKYIDNEINRSDS